jgi:hypothetical protein
MKSSYQKSMKRRNMINSIKTKFYVIFAVIMLYICTVNLIQAFSCTEMTQTQLFLHIPKSIILDFKHCK